ncbi:MAG TPA: hypothetical protein VE954_00885 [Oligoflexus sp.]|uniref:GspE/PulE/PilB domain-containing protein n=1 Tax=Oligoflexus sp. TaxID=1971216 RepID=UPI002D440666|nr:hypothetical protein [Oligoflexus sp.]HYX31635.1 hypothetical protein [Oligoflexus sp.]
MRDYKRSRLQGRDALGSATDSPQLPFYSQLPEEFLDPKLLIRLSHARCLEWQCLPICEDSAGVTIATHAQTSIEMLTEQLSRFFDKRIHWVICPETYLQAAIHRAFGFYQR